MEPNQFRETRLKITKLCNDIILLVDKKDADASNTALEEAKEMLAALTPEADGEIQERSVKNLGLKIKVAKSLIKKIKPKRTAGKKASKAAPKEYIEWDADRLGGLSANYLNKVIDNMAAGKETKVHFSAIGKGIRPSYQIDFGDGAVTAFSGSGHKPLKRKLPGGEKEISLPFSKSVIVSILEKK